MLEGKGDFDAYLKLREHEGSHREQVLSMALCCCPSHYCQAQNILIRTQLCHSNQNPVAFLLPTFYII